MEYGPGGVQGNFALPGRRQRQVTTRPCRKEINDKAKCQSLSNQFFFTFEVIFLEQFWPLYGKPVREGT
jgi:hypothetical protein